MDARTLYGRRTLCMAVYEKDERRFELLPTALLLAAVAALLLLAVASLAVATLLLAAVATLLLVGLLELEDRALRVIAVQAHLVAIA